MLPQIMPGGGRRSGYQTSRSLRFNSADSAYLGRTFSAGDRQKWTFSAWFKRSALGVQQVLFSSRSDDSNRDAIIINSSDQLFVVFVAGGLQVANFTSNMLFRDPSAWYHIVVAVDTTLYASTWIKIWVNGTQITAASSSAPGSAINGFINHSVVHAIGRLELSAPQDYFSGYVAEIHFIGGAQLTASDFGENGAVAWQPKQYTGSYSGTNSSKWTFSDNSNTTAATLGADSSGNGNNFTPNNFSVTAGVGNDSLTDTPTNYGIDTGAGGEVRGNYATLSPLQKASSATISNGNLTLTQSGAGTTLALFNVSVDKFYWEWKVSASSANTGAHGVAKGGVNLGDYPGSDALAYAWTGSGSYNNGVPTSLGAASFVVNDVIGLGFDGAAGNLYVYKNGVSIGTISTGWTSGPVFPCHGCNSGTNAGDVNYGQRPFEYQNPGTNRPASTYKALCTQNLPTPAIARGDDHFAVDTYTGTGATRSKTGLRFQPDFAWFKGRSGATDHAIYDSVRGAEKRWETNTADDEVTSDGGLTAFNSDGYTIGTLAQLNTSSATYVAWLMKKGATPGFDVVSYTGNGSNRTISHACGVAPAFMIVKARTTASTDQAAAVWHQGIANTEYLVLNSTAAKATGATYWNSTSPSSSVFSLGTADAVNKSSDTYIAYLWAEIAGFSKFGTFTGNASADGPFVWCGFKPRFVLLKNASATGGWYLWDTARDTYNVAVAELLGESAAAEAGTADLDILSNGFKIRATTAGYNGSGNTIIFAAFSEHPFKYSRAG